MFGRGRCLGAALAIAGSVASGGFAAAQEVRLGIPVVSFTVSPIYIADELGYWTKSGLQVKFPLIPGVGVNNALAAGSIEFAYGSAPTMIRGNARDQKTVAIATALNRVQLELIMSKSAAAAAGITESSPIEKKAQAMRGRKMGVDSINSVVHSYLRYVARKGGVDPERDITVTSLQGPAGLAAIKNGSIDGFTMSLPWTLIPVHEGTAIRLVSSPRSDLPELEPFVYTVILARPGYCDRDESICRRLVAGLTQAYGYLHDHPRESLEIIRKRIPSTVDPQVFNEAFELMRASTPRTAHIDAAGFAKAQDYMVATGMMKQEERLPSIEAVYTNKFTGGGPR